MSKRYKAATNNQMAARIVDREDNIYNKRIIKEILDMYADECAKSLLKGEQIRISGVCTIYPEVKTYRSCFLPLCDNETHEDAPYTRVKARFAEHFREKMDIKLLNNIKNKIYGLEYLPFDKQQITILKDGGFIPSDEEVEC